MQPLWIIVGHEQQLSEKQRAKRSRDLLQRGIKSNWWRKRKAALQAAFQRSVPPRRKLTTSAHGPKRTMRLTSNSSAQGGEADLPRSRTACPSCASSGNDAIAEPPLQPDRPHGCARPNIGEGRHIPVHERRLASCPTSGSRISDSRCCVQTSRPTVDGLAGHVDTHFRSMSSTPDPARESFRARRNASRVQGFFEWKHHCIKHERPASQTAGY